MTKSAPVTLPARSLASRSTRSATSPGSVKRPVAAWPACWAATSAAAGPPRRGDGLGHAAVAEPEPGRDRARADGVDPDAVRAELLGQRLGEAGQRGLGGGVVDHRGVGEERVDRGRGDDRPGAGREHVRHDGAGRPDGGHEGQLPRVEPVLVGDLGEAARADVRGADVVDQDVDPALLGRGGDQLGAGLGAGQVDARRGARCRRRRAPPARRRACARRRSRARPRPPVPRVIASPMPLLAPVTTTRLPSSPSRMAYAVCSSAQSSA